MIKIQRLSKDKLTKHEYCFDIRGTQLVYSSYMEYNRSTKREKWADEKPDTLNFWDWCKKNNYSFDYCDYYINQEYDEYLRDNDSVLQKTRTGKAKLSGISATIKDLPKCPPQVANAAALEFCLQLKVIYE